MSSNFHSDKLGFLMLLSTGLNEIIRDILQPILKKFSDNLYEYLLNIYRQIDTLGKYENAVDLPITNYDPVKTWERILRLSLEIIERASLKDPRKISEAISVAADKVFPHNKIEAITQTIIKQLDDNKITAQDLKLYLNQYNEIYDGKYRILLSLIHFCLDIYNNKGNYDFDRYCKNDVSYMMKEIKEQEYSKIYSDTVDWIFLGIEPHIRNAVAHQKIILRRSKVILSDKDGWEKEFDYFVLYDYLNNIKIVSLALEASLIISMVRNKDEIAKFFVDKTYEEDEIHSVLIMNAGNYKFSLTMFNIINDTIIIELKSLFVSDYPSEIMGNFGGVKFHTKLPPDPPILERVKGLVFKTLPIIWNYQNLIAKVLNDEDKVEAEMVINLQRWYELYTKNENDIKKDEFEKAIKYIDLEKE